MPVVTADSYLKKADEIAEKAREKALAAISEKYNRAERDEASSEASGLLYSTIKNNTNEVNRIITKITIHIRNIGNPEQSEDEKIASVAEIDKLRKFNPDIFDKRMLRSVLENVLAALLQQKLESSPNKEWNDVVDELMSKYPDVFEQIGYNKQLMSTLKATITMDNKEYLPGVTTKTVMDSVKLPKGQNQQRNYSLGTDSHGTDSDSVSLHSDSSGLYAKYSDKQKGRQERSNTFVDLKLEKEKAKPKKGNNLISYMLRKIKLPKLSKRVPVDEKPNGSGKNRNTSKRKM